MVYEEIILHYKKKWNFDNFKLEVWGSGPMVLLRPNFRIIVVPPTKVRNMWTYATVGMSDDVLNPLELHIFSLVENNSIVEILTAIAYYHIIEGGKLVLDDTVNFGKSILAGSICNYGLISLPYLDGEDLEKAIINNKDVSFFWLIPITKSERDYRWKYSIESLEEGFEGSQFNYLDFTRKSVV